MAGPSKGEAYHLPPKGGKGQGGTQDPILTTQLFIPEHTACSGQQSQAVVGQGGQQVCGRSAGARRYCFKSLVRPLVQFIGTFSVKMGQSENSTCSFLQGGDLISDQ